MTTMTMTWILLAGLGLLLGQGRLAHSAWVNSYDGSFTYSCGQNKFVYYIASQHHNGAEDRLFDFSCRSLPVRDAKAVSCFWSQHVNNFDELVAYQCPHDGYITGISSYHSSGAEDRRFKFRCCRSPGFITFDCSSTGWLNNWDETFRYAVPSGSILKGMISIHHSGPEDRRFQFQVCKIKKC